MQDTLAAISVLWQKPAFKIWGSDLLRLQGHCAKSGLGNHGTSEDTNRQLEVDRVYHSQQSPSPL